MDNKYCCSEVERTVESSDGAYWTIQNSHGTWWGEDGYARLEFSEGSGVCNINTEVYKVFPKFFDLDDQV